MGVSGVFSEVMNADFDAVVYTCPNTCSTRPEELSRPRTAPSRKARRVRGSLRK
jgi:hypothetical protein